MLRAYAEAHPFVQHQLLRFVAKRSRMRAVRRKKEKKGRKEKKKTKQKEGDRPVEEGNAKEVVRPLRMPLNLLLTLIFLFSLCFFLFLIFSIFCFSFFLSSHFLSFLHHFSLYPQAMAIWRW